MKFLKITILFSLCTAAVYGLNVSPSLSDLDLIQKMDYRNPQINILREEVQENLIRTTRGNRAQIIFRKYIVEKNDNFFTIMAKTMLDHDTLSSVNRLASLWDVQPGTTWVIPNSRGIAVEGNREELSEKYNVPIDNIVPLPDSPSLYFISGKSFDSSERNFFNGTAFIRPVKGIISSGYGVRRDPFTNKQKFFKGIDIACPSGTPVIASASGKVIFTGQMGGYGNLIIIEHRNGYRTLYGHLSEILIEKNQTVNSGQRVALSGKSGNVTGPHLHFEVQRKGHPMRPALH